MLVGRHGPRRCTYSRSRSTCGVSAPKTDCGWAYLSSRALAGYAREHSLGGSIKEYIHRGIAQSRLFFITSCDRLSHHHSTAKPSDVHTVDFDHQSRGYNSLESLERKAVDMALVPDAAVTTTSYSSPVGSGPLSSRGRLDLRRAQ